MMLDYVVRLLVECHARAYPNIDNHNIVKQRAAIKIQLQTCVCTRTKLAASRRKNLTVSWCTMFFSRFACVHCFWQKHLPSFPYAQWTFLHTTTHKLSYFLFVVCCTLNAYTSMNAYFAHASEVLTVCLFWSFTLLLLLCSTNLKMYVCAWIYLLMLPFFSSLHWCWNQNEAKKMK